MTGLHLSVVICSWHVLKYKFSEPRTRTFRSHLSQQANSSCMLELRVYMQWQHSLCSNIDTTGISKQQKTVNGYLASHFTRCLVAHLAWSVSTRHFALRALECIGCHENNIKKGSTSHDHHVCTPGPTILTNHERSESASFLVMQCVSR